MNNNLTCLGIESTAHTIAVAIVNTKGTILADERAMYKPKKGGLIPTELADHHQNIKDQLLQTALKKANYPKIDLIAYSNAPGLAPSLHVGQNLAKELSQKFNTRLIPVNHILAHLFSAHQFTQVSDPIYVFTSGANTQIISREGEYFRIIGETLDIGLGNALDKFGRAIDLSFPAGPEIEKLAKKGKYIELPYTVKGMDLTFSGIITAAQNKYQKGESKEDLCFSIQETMFAMLTEITERAVAHCRKNEVVIIGGVAANQKLISMLKSMCAQREIKFYKVPIEYAGDQAVMIAYTGLLFKESRKNQK